MASLGECRGAGQAGSSTASGCASLWRPFAEYFVICGLDMESGLEPDKLSGDALHCSPLDRPYKGKVLSHYPENVTANPFDENAVCMFSLPAGLLFRTQKHELEPCFHSFVITRENASRYYGFSLVFYEEVRNKNICNAMHTLQAMHITELSSGNTPPGNRKIARETCRSLPRSFKLSAPMSPAAVSYYDLTKDKLYVTKSISLICQMPYVRAAQLFLQNLYKSLPRQPGPGLSPEAYVYNLLYEVVLPGPGQSVKFYLPPPEPHLSPISIVIKRPNLINDLPCLDYPLREVFTLLGSEYIVQLFTSVCLENQILLRSSNYNRLMIVAECIISLLFPFYWAHVYVPILPTPLHHFLDAPVPFLMGLHSDCSTSYICIGSSNVNKGMAIGTEAALCLVDIDKPSIQLPEELPTFPYKNEFIEEILQLLDRFQIPRPEYEQNKMQPSANGLSQRYNVYQDPMTSSCTLPSGGGSRRKHSFNDILDWDETKPLSGSPPSPTHFLHNHSPYANRVVPPKSEALQRIVDIVRRTGVNIDDLDPETVMPSIKKKKFTEEEQYLDDMKFNNIIKETFLNRFVHMFSSYESFVIFPDQDKESWTSSRELMQNFDKAAFLSDQPDQHRPFLSQFLESQMFATFIDNKILSTWGDFDSSIEIFDNKIKAMRKRYGGDSIPIRSICYEPYLNISSSMQKDGREEGDDECPPPHEVTPHRAAYYRAFPLLDTKILEPPPPKSYGERSNSLRKNKQTNLKWQTKDIAIEKTNLDLTTKILAEPSHITIAQTNKAFVEKLLKDCKSKTKKMLLEKMGSEAADLGLGTEISIVGIEENMMIASLCDLLERIWSHGLQHKFGKSALWMHLTNYQELEQCNDTSKPIDPKLLTPDLSTAASESDTNSVKSHSPHRSRDSSRASSRESSRDRLSSASSTLERRQNQMPLRPLPESLTFDMRNIQAMSDIKTEIGYARAWVRLSLEKKLLSKHLKTLLSDTALLKSQYKKTAFVRCEDEKEQFLYHLLTLNAVDYYCFTNTYPMTKLPYRVVIVPSRKASATTANCWLSLSGTNGETQRIPIPKNTLEFVFHHKNLGILTTLRIGHDNSGLSPKWMIENVFVRNEVTGLAYKFPCNRWLGRGIDDGSTERLLVAQSTNPNKSSTGGTLGRSERRQTEQPCSSFSSLPPPSPAIPATTHLSPSTVQHMIGDCVNAIVKWHYSSRKDKDANSLSILLCGENGLVKCLEQAFLCGFKSSRLFGRNLFIWDYFVRVKEVFEQNLSEECADSASDSSSGIYSYHSPTHTPGRTQEHTTIWRCYCHLMDEINNQGRAIGKDGKFQIFICLSLREHWLHRMLVPMSMTKVTAEMYEEQSFLRKRGLLTFLRQILEPLDECNIVLENSITRGILSYS